MAHQTPGGDWDRTGLDRKGQDRYGGTNPSSAGPRDAVPTFEHAELVGPPALRRVAIQDAEQLPPVVGVLRRLVIEQKTDRHTHTVCQCGNTNTWVVDDDQHNSGQTQTHGRSVKNTNTRGAGR